MNDRRPTLTYYTATSLDGFIADAEDSLAWLFGNDQDHEGLLNYDAFFADIGAIVMGATTYEWVLAHSADVVEEVGSPWPYDLPAFVMTHRDLSAEPGRDIRFASGEVRAVHDAMVAAADGKDLWVVGGGDLAGQFADAGLLDEVITYVAPVTLGSGRPLLPRRLALELVETGRNRDFTCHRYRVRGPGEW
ncbi:dihydrofolate reductase family protein [Nocardioides panacisoli]|uniref:dihydrofolate reductase family protein n=1 Tax=Nocardioides panacisoli TaxID=627624 RepID=UPI001C6273BF|nr:dihydrofolate reductase family protein [Nocardioides panacisoli]QYJ02744.1 dihydrofolate reductase family protein [Nocardioides panacisoli]